MPTTTARAMTMITTMMRTDANGDKFYGEVRGESCGENAAEDSSEQCHYTICGMGGALCLPIHQKNTKESKED